MKQLYKITVFFAICCLLLPHFAEAKQIRSSAAKAEFKRMHPCPETGKRRGSCPGYVVDHIVPLCAGGADNQANMQWQTVEEGKIKDRDERRQCAKKHLTALPSFP